MVLSMVVSGIADANILSRWFNQIGIGIANGAPNGGSGATYATDFGG